MKAETKALVFLVTVILILSAIIIASFGVSLENERKSTADCPTDTRVCADGTNITRTQPLCELKPCPVDD